MLLRKLLLLVIYFFSFSPLGMASEISITMDDFVLRDGPLLTATQKDERILEALKKHKHQAAMFVVGRELEKPLSQNRLKEWDNAGHLIANHTYTHRSYHTVSFKEFSDEILRTELKLKDYRNFQKLFRFVQLKGGDTAEKREEIQNFLKLNGYKNGYVTIDASDWYINLRLIEKLQKDPKADLKPYRDYYLAHIWDRAEFYSQLTKKVLGREVPHTLLVHHNLLNALFMDDLLSMFEKKGWKLIDAAKAFNDPVFDMKPTIIPSGEGIIWSLAKESGKYDALLRYPAESDEYEKPKMDRLGL